MDFGCGPGYFLKTASEKGWRVRGVDVSGFAVDYAKNELNLKEVHCGENPPEKWKEEKADVLTLWAVIEHLPRPWDVIRELRNYIKSDGIICLSTGNYDSIASQREKEAWRLMTPPGHLFYFTKKTIRRILQESGFKIVKYRTNDYFGKNPPRLFRIRQLRKILRTAGLGDIMTVFARKIR